MAALSESVRIRSIASCALPAVLLLASGCASVAVKGRVVRHTNGRPVANAIVTVVTGRPEIDDPGTLARLGGLQGLWRLSANSVALESTLRELGGWKARFRARTDDDGRFAIRLPRDLPPFRFEVESRFGAYPFSLDPFVVPSPAIRREVTLRLEPAGSVRGSVRAPDGRRVTAGRVGLESLEPPFAGTDPRPPDAVEIDGNGEFVLHGVPAGRFVAAAVCPGWSPVVGGPFEVRGGRSARVELAVAPEASMSGRVIDRDGSAVGGAWVLSYAEGPPLVGRSAVASAGGGRGLSDERGEFRLGSLLPGRYQVRVGSRGFLPVGWRPGEVGARGDARLPEFVLEAGSSVSGRVLDATGHPVAGASVRAATDLNQTDGAQPLVEFGMTGADGAFRLDGVPLRPLTVDAAARGKGTAQLRGVAAGAESIDLVLSEASRIAGFLRDAQTGDPVRESWIRADLSEWPGWGGEIRQTLAEDGSFEIPDLLPGSYRVTVSAPGYLVETIEKVDVGARLARAGVVVRLRRGGIVTGRVVDDSGAPAGFAWIRAVPHTPDSTAAARMSAELDSRSVRAAADGSYRVSGLPEGPWRVLAEGPGLVPALSDPVDVVRGGRVAGVGISVARTGSIEGVALDEEGRPLVGARVIVSDGRRRWITPGTPAGAGVPVEANGHFRIGGLVPGGFVVEVQPPSTEASGSRARLVVEAPVFVASGELRRVEFGKPARVCEVRGRVVAIDESVHGATVQLAPHPPRDGAGPSRLFESRQTRTDEHGAFAFTEVPVGAAELRVATGDERDPDRVELFEVPDAREARVELSLALGRIEGRITRASDGAGVRPSWLEVAGPGLPDGRRGIIAAADGRFRTGYLRPGRYDVRVLPGESGRPEGGLARLLPDAFANLEVLAGRATLLDFALEAGGLLVVRVFDADGQPAPHVPIAFFRADGSRVRLGERGEGEATSGTDGAFGDDAFPVGAVWIDAGRRDSAFARIPEVVVEPDRVTDVRIDLIGATEVQVRFAEHFVPPRGKSVFVDAEGREYDARFRDPERSFVRKPPVGPRLVPGDYTLLLEFPGYRPVRMPVRVGTESPQVIEVRLEPN